MKNLRMALRLEPTPPHTNDIKWFGREDACLTLDPGLWETLGKPDTLTIEVTPGSDLANPFNCVEVRDR